MDPQTANSLAARGFTGSYTVEMPTYSTSVVGSVLLVAVTGGGAATVEHTLTGVITALRSTLAGGLQAGVRADNRIQVTVLAPAASATVNITHTVRSLAIVAGLGLVIAFGVPWIIDAQVSRQMTGGPGIPGVTRTPGRSLVTCCPGGRPVRAFWRSASPVIRRPPARLDQGTRPGQPPRRRGAADNQESQA